ncbi:MAG: hypothetical protein H7833_00560 [Magnetococcus sp. DMHC-1]
MLVTIWPGHELEDLAGAITHGTKGKIGYKLVVPARSVRIILDMRMKFHKQRLLLHHFRPPCNKQRMAIRHAISM